MIVMPADIFFHMVLKRQHQIEFINRNAFNNNGLCRFLTNYFSVLVAARLKCKTKSLRVDRAPCNIVESNYADNLFWICGIDNRRVVEIA